MVSHFRRLKVVCGLHDHPPLEWIGHVRLGSHTNQGLARVTARPHQFERMGMLCIAQPPVQNHEDQRRNRPPSSPKQLLLRADLAIR